MAGNRVNVTLGFNADTSQAQQAIQKLNQQLTNIQNIHVENIGINQELTQAAQAAQTLQTALQSAMNSNTGQINMTQFSLALKSAGTSVRQISDQLRAIGPTGTAAFTQLSQSISMMDVPLKKTNSTLTTMMTTLKNTAKWEMASTAIHGIEKAFSNAVNYVTDLNEALTNIRVVSNQSVDDMSRFTQQANLAAKSLGTTTKEYAKAALTYYQQGDSSEMAAKKAEITLKATNVAFKATAQEMSDMLTSTWNGFQANADELEHYVDVMANLGSHTASSVEEIATALQKVAATANTVGMSMEQVSAMIATVSSTTRQNAATVGTALNTILSRFESLKLGETLEDGLDLTKYTKALQTIGVNVLDINGELRDMGSVVDDIMQKWQTLSDGQKTALANTVGGVRQYTNIMALFNNQDKYYQNLGYAENSEGALDKMQETYMTGIKAAQKKLQATKEGFWGDLISEDNILDATKALTGFVDQVQNLMNSLGGIKGVATTLGGILTTVFSKQIGSSIAGAITKIQTFNQSIGAIHGKTGFDTFKQRATSLFTQNTNQRIYEQMNQQFKTELGRDLNVFSDNGGMTAQIESAQILLDKKRELVQVESTLNDTQKAQAQASMTQMQQQVTQIATLNQSYQQQTSAIQSQKNALMEQTDAMKLATNASEFAAARKADNDKANSWMQSGSNAKLMAGFLEPSPGTKIFSNLFSDVKTDGGLSGLLTQMTKLEQISGACSTQLEKINAVKMGDSFATSGDKVQVLNSALNALETRFQQLGADGGVEQVQKLRAELESLQGTSGTAFETGINNVTNGIKNLEISSSNASILIQNFANGLGISATGLRELAAAANISEQDLAKVLLILDLLKQKSQETNFANSPLAQGIQKFARGIGSAVMQFSTLSNLTANWDTSNLTSKVTGIGMAFSNIMSNFGNWPAMAMSAVGAVAGIIVGQMEAEQKRFETWGETQKKQISEFTVLSDTDKQELETNNELMQSYADLYDQKLQGASVDDQLIAEGMKLISHFQLQGQELELLAGNYEVVAEKARDAAKAQAESKLAGLETKLQQKETLLGNVYAEGSERQVRKFDYYDMSTGSKKSDVTGSGTKAYQLNESLREGNVTFEQTEDGNYQVSSGKLTGYAGFGGYRDYKYASSVDWVDPTAGYNSYNISADKGFTQAETLKIGVSGTVGADWQKNVEYLMKSPLGPYLLQTYAGYNLGDFSEGDHVNLLASKTGDSANYRRNVITALSETLAQMVKDGKQDTDEYANLEKIYSEWKSQQDQLDTAWQESKAAVDELNRAELVGRTKKSTWKEYTETRDAVSANYTKYSKYLDIEPGTETKAAQDFLIENSDLSYHVAADRMINDAASTISDPALEKKFRDTTEAYINKYGVESINTYALQHIKENYDTEGYNVLEDQSLRSLSASTEGITTQTETATEKLKKAQSALKQTLNGEELMSAMEQAVEWGGKIGEEQIMSLNDFLKMSYEEQVAYLNQLERAYTANAVKIKANNLSAKKIAQTEAKEAYDEFLTTNNLTEDQMTQASALQSYYGVETNQDETIRSILANGPNNMTQSQTVLMTKLNEIYRSSGSEAPDIEQWYRGLTETERGDVLKEAFNDDAVLSALQGGISSEKLKEYQALKAGLVTDEDISNLESEFNASMVAEFNARLLEAQNNMTDLNNIIANGPQSVKDWELLEKTLGKTFDEIKDLSPEDLNKQIQTALQTPFQYMTPEDLEAKSIDYTSDLGRMYKAWEIGESVYDQSQYTKEQAEAAYLEEHPEITVATPEQQKVLDYQRKKLQEAVDTDIQNKAIAEDVSNLEKYEKQLNSLKDAQKEFLNDGELKQSTKNALERLGIKEDDYKSAEALAVAIRKVKENLVTTRDSLKTSMGNIANFNGTLEDATMTWETFKKTYNLGDDDHLKSTFESWQTAFWDAKTAYDGWSTSALEAEAKITKSINAQKMAQDQLTQAYNQAKAVSDEVKTAFEQNAQLTVATAKKLQADGIIWGDKQADNLSNYGKILGNTAIKQAQMLQGQKYKLDQAAIKTNKESTWFEVTHDTDFGKETINSLIEWNTELTQFKNLENDIVPLSEALAGGDGTLAKKIQDMVTEAKAAGQTITWGQIFSRLSAENLNLDNQIATVWDTFTQNGISAVEAVLAEHSSAAADIVNTWTQAFQAIAAAQETFAKGLTLAYDSNEDALKNQIAVLMNLKNEAQEQLYSNEDILALLQGGTAANGDTAEQAMEKARKGLELPTREDWAVSKGDATRFLYNETDGDVKSNGEGRAKTPQAMFENAEKLINSQLDTLWSGLTEDEEKIFNDKMAELNEQRKKEGLKEITPDSKEEYKKYQKDYLLKKYFGTTDKDSEKMAKVFTDAVSADLADIATKVGDRQKAAEANVNAVNNSPEMQAITQEQTVQNRIKAAVDKAKGLLNSDESLETGLTEQEKKDVLEATGQIDLANVNLNNLQSASVSAATALANLAAAAKELTKAQAEKYGFKENDKGQWEYYDTGTKEELEQAGYITSGEGKNAHEILDASGQGTGMWQADKALQVSTEMTSKMQSLTDAVDAANAAVTETKNAPMTDVLKANNWKSVEDAQSQLRQELSLRGGITPTNAEMDTAEELANMKAAIELYDKQAAAVENLESALTATTGAFDVLANKAANSPGEVSAAYQTFAGILTDFFGQFEVTTPFIDENLETIKEWANGSVEAIEILEEKILTQQVEDIVKQQGKSVEEFTEQIKELGDVGDDLKLGEKLGGQGVGQLKKMQKEFKATNKEMDKVIANMRMTNKEWTKMAGNDLVDEWGADEANDLLKEMGMHMEENADGSKRISSELIDSCTTLNQMVDAIKQTGAEGFQFDKGQTEGLMQALGGDDWTSDLMNLAQQQVEIPVDFDIQNPEVIDSYLDKEGTLHINVEGLDDIQLETVTGENEFDVHGSGTGKVGDTTFTNTMDLSAGGSTVLEVPKPKGSGGGGGGDGRRGGGGGGGRRNKQKKDDHDRTRYHQTDRQLKKQSDLLTKNDKLKSRKYGSNYLDILKEENKTLEEQISLNEKKIKEAQKYMEKDKNELESLGATFDEDGNINYDAYEKLWQDKYNAKVEEYNAGTIDDDAWTEFQNEYDDALDAVSKYEEAQDRVAEAQEEILEAQNQISANLAEAITYELDLKIEFDQRQLDLLASMLKDYENDLTKQNKVIDNYLQQIKLVISQSQSVIDSLGTLNSTANVTGMTTDNYGTHFNITQDENGFINGSRMTARDYAETLRSIGDQAQTELDALRDWEASMLDVVNDVIQLGEEKFANLANSIKHYSTMISGYMELVDLYGENQGPQYDKKKIMLESQYNVQMNQVDMYQKRMEEYRRQELDAQAEVDAATREGDQDKLKYAQQALEDIKAQKETAEEEWLDAVKEAAQTAKDLYQNTVDEIIYNMKRLNGEDMDWIQQKSDLWKQANELYVDEITEAYEMDKLTRQIENSIADTRSKSNRAELQALKEKIKLQSESNQLSEYDIEMMNKEYELLLAKQELEKAEDAKDTVRLTRDENGNMIYQYTADQDAISEAEQKYNDVLYEMHKTTKEHLNELYDTLAETEAAWQEAIDQIWNDATLTQEEKLARMEQVNEQYGTIIDALSDQIQVTTGNLNDYNTRISKTFGENIQDMAKVTQEEVNKVLETELADTQRFKTGMETVYKDLKTAADQYKDKIDDLSAKTHTKWEDMQQDLKNYEKESEKTRAENDKLIQQISQQLTNAINEVIKKFKEWYEELKKKKKLLEEYIQTINNTIKALADLSSAESERDRRDRDQRSSDDGRRSGSDDSRRNPSGGGSPRGKDDDRRDGHGYEITMSDGSRASQSGYTSEQQARADADYVSRYIARMQRDTRSGSRITGTRTYKTGGLADFTGPAWLDGTKQRPEYVLNSEQTSQMFGILSSNTIERLLQALNYAANAMLSVANINTSQYMMDKLTSNIDNDTIQQQIYINADFPHATDSSQIQDALTTLANKASHYKNKTTRLGI